LITEGVRPWGNPWGAVQFGSAFFMITGCHGTHVTIGVIFLLIVARKVWRGDYEAGAPGFFTSRRGQYESVEIMGLYWHFVDLVWVFIFAFFYLWRGGAMAQAEAREHGLHGHATSTQAVVHAQGQQHPIKLYLVVWGWLFILSACSYAVDYFALQGYLRWGLIVTLMTLKAGLIVAV